MHGESFPISVDDLVATLIELYRHQGKTEMASMLETATASIEHSQYDQWDGGTNYWSLHIQLPVAEFARIEPSLSKVEKNLHDRVRSITRTLTHDHISIVTITPLAGVIAKRKPPSIDVQRVWKEGFFRLFLSHVSAHKAAVAQLKDELRLYGVSAFVAHEDITPSLEWQNEIEVALNSMHALAALLTADFHPSNWTDQEVGFALGRGVLVVPVRLGIDPYGFIGKVQGVKGSLERPKGLANALSCILLQHPSTHDEMRRAMVRAFVDAKSFSSSQTLSKILSDSTDFTEGERDLIVKACQENDQIYNAHGVVTRICKAIGRTAPKVTTSPSEADDVPF